MLNQTNIAVRLDSWFSQEFPEQCTTVCKLVPESERLGNARINMLGWWFRGTCHQRFHMEVDDWKEGVTALQRLGFVQWTGVMYSPGTIYGCSSIPGEFRLQIGHRQGLMGNRHDDGDSGEELKSLYCNDESRGRICPSRCPLTKMQLDS